MTKQKRTPYFHTLLPIVFPIPKNYTTTYGVMFFYTAFVQPLNSIQFLSSMKNSFLPQLNIQPILRNFTDRN